MKSVKLLLVAIVIIGAIIVASKLLGGNEDPSIQKEVSENRGINEIRKLINDGEDATWSVSLKANYYNNIEMKINTYRNNPEMTADIAQNLKRSLDITYMNILAQFVESTIPNCDLSKQLTEEINEFYKIDNEHNGIKRAHQSVQDYNSAYSVMKSASDLKETISEKFYGENIHNRAQQLKQIELINKCKRIKDGLQKVDEDLAIAHIRFLERQTEIFKTADYSDIKDKRSLLDKFKPIFDSFDSFEKIVYYPSTQKSQEKNIRNDMEKFLDDTEKKVLDKTENK